MTSAIKTCAVTIMVCTGAAVTLLAAFGMVVYGIENAITLRTIFEILGANSVINIGLLLTKKFESSFAVLEYAVDTGYTIAVLAVTGFIFNWYSTIPFWYLAAMAVVIYVFAVATNIVRTRKDIKEINTLLQKCREKT
jgi:hypothetical protein